VSRRQLLARAIAIGIGATAIMDISGEVLRRVTGFAPLDYRLVGRWIGHMRHGRLRHDDIHTAPPIANEPTLGCLAHSAIGTGVATALVAGRPAWAARPTLLPALATGVASSAAPLLLMQPAFGMGIAASKTPNPTRARLQCLRTHAIYGAGLYLTAVMAVLLRSPTD
jgi:Protein of unknown function (DUF2938)